MSNRLPDPLPLVSSTKYNVSKDCGYQNVGVCVTNINPEIEKVPEGQFLVVDCIMAAVAAKIPIPKVYEHWSYYPAIGFDRPYSFSR